jgi:LAO/AO transport system kinase
MMLEHGSSDSGWRPRVFQTVAVRGEGVDQLMQGILEHREFLFEEHAHRLKVRERSRWIFRALLQDRMTTRAMERLMANGGLEAVLDRITRRDTDPYTAVEEVMALLGL